MSEKQLYGDRDFDQLDHVGSKFFQAEIVNKYSNYETHTFYFLCLSDSERPKLFFAIFRLLTHKNYSVGSFRQCCRLGR